MQFRTLLAASGLFLGLSSAAAFGQTLVYCSEGSPEGFDPALYTAGTTFDASSQAMYDRLTDFETGTTNVVPGLAESWTSSEDGLVYTFNLRKGVKFHSNDMFAPSRDFNADDVVFTFERQRRDDHPYHTVSGGTWEYFDGMGMPGLVASIEKVDDYTVKFVLNHPEAPFVSNMAMDFASILSAEYADAMMAAGTPEMLNQAPIGTGAFEFVAYQKDAVIRYQAHDEYWRDGPAQGRQPGICDHARQFRSLPETQGWRMPYHALSESCGHSGDAGRRRHHCHGAGGSECRLPGLQHDAGPIRQSAGSTGAQHGDRQAGDH